MDKELSWLDTLVNARYSYDNGDDIPIRARWLVNFRPGSLPLREFFD